MLARRVIIAAFAVASLPLLTGCFNGFGATTTMQATQNSGNGVDSQVGAMKVQNATIVRGENGSATLMMTLVNVGQRDDTLTSVTIGGTAAVITDGAAAIDVRYVGILPDLFREGQGVIAEGRMLSGVFEARNVLAKHDETYMPPEVVEALKKSGEWKGGKEGGAAVEKAAGSEIGRAHV